MKQVMMVKQSIIIKPHSFIDVITNSSSELFVMNNKEQEEVEAILKEIYPDYLSEYEPLQDVKNFTNNELDSFLSWHLGRKSGWWRSGTIYDNKDDYVLLSGFSFEEIYDTSVELSSDYRSSEYHVINNNPDKSDKWGEYFVTDENREKVINGIIKDVGRYFLYSLGENPDWDMQEQLMLIGTRYHLG